MIRHQVNQRYAFDGSSVDDAVAVTSYSLVGLGAGEVRTHPIMKYGDVCVFHGSSCIGHIESHNGMHFLPTFLTPGTEEQPHDLMTAKMACVKGSLDYDEYKNRVVSHMRGKRGSVRSINSLTVQGSIRMVISPLEEHHGGSVSIPKYIADSTWVLDQESLTYKARCMRNGDRAILVRQPCMWIGGIQPIHVIATPPDVGHEGLWDVNASMRLPISMCGPFGADYDGDEMTIFAVTTQKAKRECEAFEWPHDDWSPYNADYNDPMYLEPGDDQVVAMQLDDVNPADLQAMCTSVCWLDRTMGLRITHFHERWLTKKAQFISMTEKHDDVDAFLDMAMSLTISTCSKSSLQSDVGATSRRSKLGSERVILNKARYPMVRIDMIPWKHMVRNEWGTMLTQDGWFGSPALRFVSKLCASVMQITLKVKSSASIELLSPTLSLLEGSQSWIVIMADNKIRVANAPSDVPYDQIKCTCSLMDISYAPEHTRRRLVREFMRMVKSETGKRADEAEDTCMELLLLSMVVSPLREPIGIRIETNKHYGEFSVMQRINGCYVTDANVRSWTSPVQPYSTVECMMLGQFGTCPSICHESLMTHDYV